MDLGIKGKNISISIKNREIFSNFSFFIPKNRITFILGKSGAGKSILSQIMVGLIDFQGRLTIDSKPPQKKMITYIFQEPTLLDFLTLEENIFLPIKKFNRDSHFIKNIYEIMDDFGFNNLKSFYPKNLTPVQQKIASIIRALTTSSEYIIFDEPTTGLDENSTDLVFKLINQTFKNSSITPIIVSHDINYALNLADYIIFLDNGESIFHGERKDIFYTQNSTILKFLS
ncbi:ATP-binding cassette domain-containing protein [bacterium]|nr:ATP-binding cassette domain-containing protein [bacterium]